mmetsp:Transcript_22848/g.40489  ORF Transcript_22848/g.40489 Transcript_22848/m.40489 type:complete len:636 (+) Transcript_22848:82-1989(+)
MSSRHKARLRREEEERLRALRNAGGEEDEEGDVDSDDGGDDDEDEGQAKAFGALMGSSSESEEEEEQEEQEQGEEEEDSEEDPAEVDAEEAFPPPPPSAMQPKAVRGRRTGNAMAQGSDDEMNELEEAIKQAQLEAEEAKAAGLSGDQGGALLQLLALEDLKALNPDTELRRKIGRVTGSTNEGGQSTATRPRRGVRGQPNQSSRRSHKAVFVSLSSDEVPPEAPAYASGGARMSIQGETVDGGVLLGFDASDTYHSADKAFAEIFATNDPNMIMSFIRQNPWHVPAFLAMSNVYIQTSQMEAAEMMLRSALYVLECWLHPRFVTLVQEGRCRLHLSQEATSRDCGLNQDFVFSLFSSMLACRRKSLTETAFSQGVLIFALDPNTDPLFMLLILDQLALLAGQEEWLLKLVDTVPSCQVLPNMFFARAVALLRQGKEVEAQRAADEAIQKFPNVLPAIAADLRKDGDIPASDAVLDSAISRCVALSQQQPVDPLQDRIVTVMARTGKSLWKSKSNSGGAPIYQWFAFRAANMEEGSASAVPPPSTDLESESEAISDEKSKTILAHYGKVQLAQFEDSTGAFNVIEGAEGAGAGAAAAQADPNVALDGNVLRLFFETMLPWARLPSRGAAQQGDPE